MRVTLGKSRVRESRLPKSVRAKAECLSYSTTTKQRGLDHLGAKSGNEAAAAIAAQMSGEEAAYDPLMDCNNMIWSRGLEMCGLYLMTQKPDGSDFCSICEAVAHPLSDGQRHVRALRGETYRKGHGS